MYGAAIESVYFWKIFDIITLVVRKSEFNLDSKSYITSLGHILLFVCFFLMRASGYRS